MELSSSKIKNHLYFVLYFRKWNSLIFWETETPKNFLIFQERYIQNPCITELSYISRKEYTEPWHNRTLSYFGKSIFTSRAYLELEVYSEPSYNLNPRHIRNTVKHLRWSILQKIATWNTFRPHRSKIFPKKKNILKNLLIFPEMERSSLLFLLYFRK